MMLTKEEKLELSAAHRNVRRLMALGDVSRKAGVAMLRTLGTIGRRDRIKRTPQKCAAFPNCYCCNPY